MAPKTPTTKTILLIDIAHTSVGVAVVSHADGTAPRMLAAWRELLAADPAEERLFDFALRSMRKLVEKANSAGYAAWDEVYCSVGTPWVITHVRSAGYSADKPFIVTEKLLQQIDERDLERFFGKEAHQHAFADHSRIVDHERLVATVNGHHLKNNIGQRAREVESTYLVSGMDPGQYAQLQSAIYVVTHREAAIHAIQYMHWKATRNLKGADNYLFFDFHGSFGECMVVRDDIIRLTAATAIAEESYVRDIGNSLGIENRSVRRLIDTDRSGVLHDTQARALREADDVLLVRYADEFRYALQSIAEHGLLPNQVFFITDYGAQFFSRLLSSPEFADLTVLHAQLQPVQLTSELLQDRVDTQALSKIDSTLLLSAFALTQS